MQFIEISDGYIPRERVVRVIPNEDGGEYDHVEYTAGDGTVRTVRLEAPIGVVLGSTILAAMPGYRVVRVQLADATAPALITVTPVIAWRVSDVTGVAEPVTQYVADLDPRSAECAIEAPGTPGVVSHGVAYVTLDAFVESRRDAVRAAMAAEATRRAARVAGVL